MQYYVMVIFLLIFNAQSHAQKTKRYTNWRGDRGWDLELRKDSTYQINSIPTRRKKGQLGVYDVTNYNSRIVNTNCSLPRNWSIQN